MDQYRRTATLAWLSRTGGRGPDGPKWLELRLLQPA
jgi:hypothetical protein